MSFLPYGNRTPSAWVSSLGLSGAAHGALVAAFVMGSVPLLPTRTPPPDDEQDFFVSLEILDAEIIKEFLPETDAVLPLPEVDALEEVLPETEVEDFAALTPETLTDITEEITPELVPDTALEPEEIDVPEPEVADILPDTPPDDVAPEILSEAPVAEAETEAVLGPVALAPQPDPDTLMVDDLSPVEDSVISPLAEGGSASPVPEFLEDTTAPQPVFPDDPLVNDVVTLPEPEAIVPDAVETDNDTLALLVPEDTAPLTDPVISDDPLTETVQPAPDTSVEPEIIEPDPPSAAGDTTPELDEPVAIVDTAPAGTVISNPTPQDVALGRLLQRIRSIPAPQCSVALPRRAANGDVGLSLIGADGLVLTQYANRVLDRTGIDPIQSRELIDARQCAVVEALKSTTSYPANRIGLSLEQAQLYSGQPLRARVEGAGGLFVTLLLIDDNGVVQDLSRFTELDGSTLVIDAPVTRTGASRSTRQMLLVLGTPDAPIDLSAQIGGMADDAFALIDPAQLANAVFGIASFDVQ